MTTPDEIHGASFHVYWTPGGQVRFDSDSDATMTKADAQAAVDAVATITDGKPTGLLVDMSRIRGMDRDARTVFAGADVSTRVAMLVKSPLSRTLGSFFLGLNKPALPMRLFSDETKALAWLAADGS